MQSDETPLITNKFRKFLELNYRIAFNTKLPAVEPEIDRRHLFLGVGNYAQCRGPLESADF